ncbi:ABC transporter ATP-binding protein [Desulfoprunum benzoelyticum]|uniref:Peptide/nickel transport system ATP-binding protein n=1 Tax=Desulfoprunum benzoelyticum TaxID=1506996 RepID=A0A840UQ47_9BACT|nr:ABC transporter ATP-binding protein [Desulfoprunum benzoelyticum]MBB5346703.1 peptide/nickel transport system ATP-binding protein [Desulfoprunum benzoelyticum]MBM9529053.1 ABC transporter ATP-binding protein [Desulfoprunum benzoelyticum]
MPPLLKIRNIVIEGQTGENWEPIVKGLDLTLHKGEILGLIGESGAGKSTLGLAAMCYTRPGCRIASGSIVFDGQELFGMPESQLRNLRGARIAYVAQSAAANFNPAHRLIRQYAEGPVQHGLMTTVEAEANAVAIYEQLLLPDPENIGYRFPHQVSGGQLQRAMVAMAMSCRPDIIIFDEPTTALDVTTQIEVLAAIREITARYDTAAIYITHDLAVVAQIADRIMVLRNGDLVEENDARKMLAHPQQSYTRDLLAVRSFAKKALDADSEVILDVADVTASYNGQDNVLEDISLQVRRGRTVALVGESGSGKSTLARVITGLLPPSSGSIVFQGEELPPAMKSRRREELRRLQMIYQMPDTALNPRQKIRMIIGRPLQFYFGLSAQEQEQRTLELLAQIELPEEYIDRYPTELSGGEKQRVCIARALAARPALIICDEVTSALDQLVAEGILRLLLDLQRKLDVSYLFITHDLATVKAIADEIVVMRDGRIVEQGPRNEILTPPHHDYTDLLLSSVPQMDPDWLDNLLAEREAA